MESRETHTERDCEATLLCGAEQLHKEVSVLNTQHVLFCKHLSGPRGCLRILHFFFLQSMTSHCRVCLRISGLLSKDSILKLCDTFGPIWLSGNDKLERLGMRLVTTAQNGGCWCSKVYRSWKDKMTKWQTSYNHLHLEGGCSWSVSHIVAVKWI